MKTKNTVTTVLILGASLTAKVTETPEPALIKAAVESIVAKYPN